MTTNRIAGALAAASCLLGSAHAQSFTGDDVEGFLDVLKGSEAIGERYEGQFDGENPLAAQMATDFSDFGNLLDADGDFRVFRLMTAAMERSGDMAPVRDYRALVTGSGFAGLPEFGETADAIMMAWLATQVDPKDLAEMEAMDPAMMEMMPASMKAQLEGVMRLGEALEDVPAEDLATLKPYRKKLKKAFD